MYLLFYVKSYVSLNQDKEIKNYYKVIYLLTFNHISKKLYFGWSYGNDLNILIYFGMFLEFGCKHLINNGLEHVPSEIHFSQTLITNILVTIFSL